MKRSYKILIGCFIFFILVLLGSLFFVQSKTYQPLSDALNETETTDQYRVEESSDAIIFSPLNEQQSISILFYQGGLVEEKSYSSIAAKLAEKGYPVYLVKHALNLAVTDANKAETIITDEKIQDFVIGGHSLGGVMASRFANESYSESLKGVFLLASYPDEKGRLDKLPISVLSLIGSNDGVVNEETYQLGKDYLPATTSFYTIEGGNHAGFGDYGDQEGDLPATISPEQQQEQTVDQLEKWLRKIKENE
ncbi:alpha/beta hydrolase [Carnobacterium viridans]|uniref:Alpha/beta hydrolase family protein n=2 Tax=Carnobacterium viridans TaxID=174587 RepID=A0A1H0XRI6_9LACT|nr:alpha/beta hydrolase [Carnobacterium viridans]UDE95587.1 alpha/beta hydrolase [Carnobacterium viridans]SDQ05453.1 Alpha/beta hydrolase family protein [Carnobacterium viridans]